MNKGEYTGESRDAYLKGFEVGILVGEARMLTWVADFHKLQAALLLRDLRQHAVASGEDWEALCRKEFGRSGEEMDLEIACPITISGLTYDELQEKLGYTPEAMRRIFRDGREDPE